MDNWDWTCQATLLSKLDGQGPRPEHWKKDVAPGKEAKDDAGKQSNEKSRLNHLSPHGVTAATLTTALTMWFSDLDRVSEQTDSLRALDCGEFSNCISLAHPSGKPRKCGVVTILFANR